MEGSGGLARQLPGGRQQLDPDTSPPKSSSFPYAPTPHLLPLSAHPCPLPPASLCPPWPWPLEGASGSRGLGERPEVDRRAAGLYTVEGVYREGCTAELLSLVCQYTPGGGTGDWSRSEQVPPAASHGTDSVQAAGSVTEEGAVRGSEGALRRGHVQAWGLRNMSLLSITGWYSLLSQNWGQLKPGDCTVESL